MQAAAVQMNSTRDGSRNLAEAGRLVAEAAEAGAELVVLPEKWPWLAQGEGVREGAEPLDGVEYRESDYEEAGSEVATFEIGDRVIGLAIRYDLRFPELFRSLAEVEEGAGQVSTGLDFDQLDRVRGTLPVLRHRRADIFPTFPGEAA